MITVEMIEQLMEKTGAGFEEAKKALVENNEDMLDAILQLERAKKEEKAEEKTERVEGDVLNRDGSEAGKTEHGPRFFSSLKHFFHVLCTRNFRVTRNDREVLSFPLLVLVIAAVLAFHLVLILGIGGLFFGFRYHFGGEGRATDTINRFSERASRMADDLKAEFTESTSRV